MPGEKFSAVMFCKQFLAYTVHIDWCYHSIHKHSSRSQHAPTYMMTSGMHRHPFEGRHLVRKFFTSTTEWKIQNFYAISKMVLNLIFIFCLFKKNAYLSVSAVMFCKQFLAYAVDIDGSAFLCNPLTFIGISVLTPCTFMFRQVCIIEPSFSNATWGMHRRPIKGWHLV